MKIIGHRGAAFYCPENTLTSFMKAIELGAYSVEFDVQYSKDGIPVVIHDHSINRTTNGRGAVKNFNLKELQEHKIKGCEHIPSLEELFILVKNYDIHLDLELKDSLYKPTIDMINYFNYKNRITISSFYRKSVAEIKKLGFNTAILTTASVSPIKILDETGADKLHLYYRRVSKKIVDDVHKRGKELMVWTVDDQKTALMMEELGVDYLCTNKPDLLS